MAPVFSTSKYLTSTDGGKIYADAVGDPTKPSIVFIHGQGLSASVFDNIFDDEGYAQEYHLVRYDVRGHGRSCKPDSLEGHTSKLHADDFQAVMSGFGLKRPFVVGWSLGGIITADIASFLPDDTIAGIVYLAGLPYTGPEAVSRVGKPLVLDLLPGLFDEDSTLASLSAYRDFADSVFLDAEKVPWQIRTSWLGMMVTQNPRDRVFAVTRKQDPERLFELGRKGLPLLIMGGVHDKQVDSKGTESVMKPHYINMEVVWVERGGSHAFFLENKEETMKKILEFTDRHNSNNTKLLSD